MNKPPDIEQVLAAIQTLYSSEVAEQRSQANDWLLQVEASVYAWQLADQLLFRNASSESTYFAAHIMCSKIQNSFHELPSDAYVSLRDSLIKHIVTPNKSHITLVQLCIALADLGHQVVSWRDFTGHVVTSFSHPDHLPMLVELLTVIPEEVASRHLRLGENRRKEIRSDLVGNACGVLDLLDGAVRLHSGDPSMLAKVFKCVASWFEVNAVPFSVVAQKQLLVTAFDVASQVKTEPSLHDSACGCLCSAWLSVDGLDGEQARLADYLLQRTNALISAYHAAVADEDLDRCLNLSRIFTECGETLLDEVISRPGEGLGQLSVLENVMTCVGHPDYEVADVTFNVWYRLSETLYCKKSDAHNAVFRPYVERLVLALCRHCQLEADLDGLPDADSDFGRFRNQVLELLQDVVFLVGSENCFAQMFQLLQSPSVRASWESSEATLFVMTAVAKNLGADSGEVVAAVVSGVLQVPDTTPLPVRYTSTQLVGELHQWIEKHPQILEPVLNFLLKNLRHEKLAAIAAHSLFCICSSCKKHLTPHLTRLVQIVEAVDTFNISDDAALDLIKSTATILSDLPAADMLACFRTVCSLQLHKLSEVNGVTTSKAADPRLGLDRLAAIFQHVKVADGGSSQPLEAVLADMGPVLADTLTKHEANVDVVERYCRCLRFICRCLGRSSQPLLSQLLGQMVASYHRHRHSCFLYLASILVDEYAADDASTRGLLDMLTAFLPPTFDMLNSGSGFQNHPDTLEDLFRLCLRFVQHRPREFLSEEHAEALVRCAIAASTVKHREANASVMKFLAETFSPTVKSERGERSDKVKRRNANCKPMAAGDAMANGDAGDVIDMKRKIMYSVGSEFTENVLCGCIDSLGTYMMPDIAEVLYNMMKLDHTAVTTWLQAALNKVPQWVETKLKRNVAVTPEQMTAFYQQIVSAGQDRQVSHALKDFSRLFK